MAQALVGFEQVLSTEASTCITRSSPAERVVEAEIAGESMGLELAESGLAVARSTSSQAS